MRSTAVSFCLSCLVVLLSHEGRTSVDLDGRPVLVRFEPPPGKPEGTARLRIDSNPARPIEEQLRLEGVDATKPVDVIKKPSGRIVSVVFEKVVPVAAGRLSFLYIGDGKLLVAMKPRSTLDVRYDDCANFALDGDDLASYGDYCERDTRDCRPGYVESTETADAAEGLCLQLKPRPAGDEPVKYCVRLGEFRVRGKPGTTFALVGDGHKRVNHVVPASGMTPFYPAVYQRCWREWIVTASDEALVVVGPGQRWTVDLASDGRILGGVLDKG